MRRHPVTSVGAGDRQSRPTTDSHEAEDRWQWDIVSWLAIALVGLFVLLLVMSLSPHGDERQLKQHMKQHVPGISGMPR